MTIHEIAEKLNLHPNAISMAIRHKSLPKKPTLADVKRWDAKRPKPGNGKTRRKLFIPAAEKPMDIPAPAPIYEPLIPTTLNELLHELVQRRDKLDKAIEALESL